MSKMALVEARERLGLGTYASVNDVKAAFRRRAKDCHPDRAVDKEAAEEEMKQLNRAYRILLAYCEQVPIPLDEAHLIANSPEELFEEYVDRFYSDWFGK